jgi:hypothetical protein
MELRSEIERAKEPDVGPQGVLHLVQAALDAEKPKNYWQAETVVHRVLRCAGWRMTASHGHGRQYTAVISSATGRFILKVIIPEENS